MDEIHITENDITNVIKMASNWKAIDLEHIFYFWYKKFTVSHKK